MGRVRYLILGEGRGGDFMVEGEEKVQVREGIVKWFFFIWVDIQMSLLVGGKFKVFFGNFYI